MSSSLPLLLQSIVNSVEDYIVSLNLNREVNKPVKIRHRELNTIISWNLFMDSGLENVFLTIEKLIQNQLKNIQGELLKYTITNGSITDHTFETFNEFRIHRGKNWDVYLYEPETFAYIRLLIESRTDLVDKKWISLDIDLVRKSAWFLD